MNKSLSIFFPCYNDGGSIASMVVMADIVARELSNDYEIIVIDDGSSDHSLEVLNELKSKYSKLRVIQHEKNKGYGATLRDGFKNASKELVFYTDGDAQYDVRELKELWLSMSDDTDIVNGFKIKRHDPFNRMVIGLAYQHLVKAAFALKIRDVDCDFRLIRRSVFDHLELKNNSGVICIEMIKKMQNAGFRFKEVGTHHFYRSYGRSQIFNYKRIINIAFRLLVLWFELIVFQEGRGCGKKTG